MHRLYILYVTCKLFLSLYDFIDFNFKYESRVIFFYFFCKITKGGIKAVVHTDAWQVMVMFASVVVVTTLGTISLGGPSEVFRRATEGGRIELFK